MEVIQMNKFKTITALLLTGILTLSLLTACGNSTSSDHADSSTAGPSQIVSSAQGGQQSSPEETSDGLVVTTAGKVQGTLNDGVYTYLGVPYAHATERFVPAQAVEPWEGVFQADTYGNISPQGAMFGMPGQAQPGTDNNCQNLNIWTPGVGDDGARPVMVWLHGGGFSNGSGNDQGYQGGNLSRSGDVVVVTVNHRLNLFGHLDLSAYGEKYERSANVGITDIVAALEWIQDNIAAFGGDPDNVTVFGQSGGGAKVLALMTSPYAQGLFHKGIVQSGATETVGVNFTSQEASTRLTENFLSILNISEDNIETLQTISEDELQSAGTQALQMTADEFQIPAALGEGYSMEWEPVVDGDFLPSHPVTEESFASAGADIPLLIGSNLNEWNFFPAQEQGEQVSQELTDAVRAAYPGKTELTAGQVDTLIRLPMLKIMSHKADQNGAPVYAYLFTYGMSFHGAEIPYVFRNTEDTLEEQAMADQLSQVWVSFARTGIPGGDGIPAWEPYTRESGATMLLDTQAELVYHHDRELMNLMAPDYVY
jgi:para-nitrobenzyl esterase